MQRVALYPGTFDPVTLGHLDVIQRGAALFDHLIVAVATNTAKQSLFSVEERMEFLKKQTCTMAKVEVCSMEGLLVDCVVQRNADFILRGLRAISDFEYEFQMAAMNRKLNANVETVFLMSGESTTFISSRLIKEIASMGGDVSPFVPPWVASALQQRLTPRHG